jgi:hypothetical protein
MATAVATFEPSFVHGLLTEAPEPAPRAPTSRSGNNLAAAILWLAVEDFRFGNRENHETARKFLYPEIPAAREHLAGVCGMMNDLSFQALRESLDRLRPQWDANRKSESKSQ